MYTKKFILIYIHENNNIKMLEHNYLEENKKINRGICASKLGNCNYLKILKHSVVNYLRVTQINHLWFFI